MKHFKSAAVSIILSLLSMGLMAAGTTAVASAASISTVGVDTTAACSALTQLNPAQDCTTGGNGVTHIIAVVVNILSLVVGIAAVIMIIIAGLKFITAGGDSSGLASARNTLIYALVGLAIAVLAQFLVHFVFNTANHAANSSSGSYVRPNVRLSEDA